MSKVSVGRAGDAQSADYMLQNMSARLNTIGLSLNGTTGCGEGHASSKHQGISFSPLQGVSRGDIGIGEESLLYDGTQFIEGSGSPHSATTPASLANRTQTTAGIVGGISSNKSQFINNTNMISTDNGKGTNGRLDAIEKTLRSFKHLRSHMSNGQRTSELYSKLYDEMIALKAHVKHLGESTALACKHLTSGLTDIQEASIDTSQWAQLTSEYIDEIVNKVAPQHKQLCPKIKYTKYDS